MKKRVLQFVGSFNQGGSERQAVALTRLLSEEASFNVFLATLSGEGILRSDVEKLGFTDVPEFPIRSFFSPGFVRQVAQCAKYLRANKIDLIHTHDFYTNVFGMAAAKLAGTRARVASKRETFGMRTPNQTRVERIAFGFANAIVVNSRSVSSYLHNIGVPEKKVSIIYNGLDLNRFESKTSDHSVMSKTVTIVANLRHDVKNIPMLLRAAKTVSGTLPDANFVIAGEGELKAGLEQMATELGIADHVRFIGRSSDVPSLLAASDVCVLTSTAEGFSNSILEYMAAGKPVIATDVGGANEAVVDGLTGYLVRSDDAETLAAKLTVLLTNAGKAMAFGAEGRRIVAERFSETAQLNSTLALYNSLLS